ncbi:hypothetical protein L4C34_00305 [Vibrio profundum]|uniref:hypothetical protein n=1 Tax=Vibrio profundum TaxID=2910247 RepID=UPI003D0C7797
MADGRRPSAPRQFRRLSGYATLFVTCVLLVGVLVIVLGLYQGVWLHLRQAQFENRDRIAYWRAEGGLECAFSYLRSGVMDTQAWPSCSEMNLDVLTNTKLSLGRYQIESRAGYVQLSRQVNTIAQPPNGAINATANLWFTASLNVHPDLVEQIGSSDWVCLAMRYQHQIFADSVSSLSPDESAWVDPQNVQCASEYQTWLSSIAHAGQDFQQQDDLELFLTLFSVPRSDWFWVMSHPSFTRIPTSLEAADGSLLAHASPDLPEPDYIANCGEKISQRVREQRALIWLYGDCEITQAQLDEINSAINLWLPSGILIVIQDGFFTTASHGELNGLLYQFMSPLNADGALQHWPKASTYDSLQAQLADQPFSPSISSERVSYYQAGSFYPRGGLIIDALGYEAIFGSDLDFDYQRATVEYALSQYYQPSWQGGSWYAN